MVCCRGPSSDEEDNERKRSKRYDSSDDERQSRKKRSRRRRSSSSSDRSKSPPSERSPVDEGRVKVPAEGIQWTPCVVVSCLCYCVDYNRWMSMSPGLHCRVVHWCLCLCCVPVDLPDGGDPVVTSGGDNALSIEETK